RVAIVLGDGVEFVATFVGAMKIGAVPVPLSTQLTPADLRALIADSRARAVVVDAALSDGLVDAEAWRAVLIVGGEARRQDFAAALERASPRLDAFATRVAEPCYWLYSSGTTGRPKGVVHLHGDMLACVTPYAEQVVRMEPDDRAFSVARLFFSYGLVNSLFLPLLAGASAVLTPFRPDVAR